VTVESVVMIGNKEVKVSDLTEDQKYYYQQCLDLKNKQMKLKFDLDQINASYTVFENALTKSYDDADKKNKEEQNTETKILEK
jgi:hypothetical protein|tara:strand:- start:188 stop:436 length:249 start_codon:yes stop_codon:yes gene_type:complete